MRTPVRSRRTDRSAFLRATIGLALIVVASLALASPASAQDADTGPRDEQIVLSGRLLVAEGETVDSAVIFNGPAAIEGTVTESVVVFNGRTEVSGTVGGDVVVFNGSVTVRSGATIGGNLVTVDDPEVEPGATVRGEQRRVSTDFDATAFGFASRLVWWIGYSVSTLLLGLALPALATRARPRGGGRRARAHGRDDRIRRGGVLPAARRRRVAAGDRRGDPARTVPDARVRVAVHDRVRLRRPRARASPHGTPEVAVRRLPGGLGDPACDRADPAGRRASRMVAAIVGLGALWVAAASAPRRHRRHPESLAVPPMPPTAS